ncbi:hypothetical protein [Paractinoplanes brasiliensis]|uniref:Uncharacterized protein n=1 Tax=Paractinoplanes brasiliensis TaxID=52695 RepID=A0A4R6JU78_9ACTN|nr:hypothetical protein [Actinoplanes brasiliensis]TDO40250.1 hypothetical protein C8E87_3961 [Actinoplanes brasiliensis]GID25315.1 hypothetical protein Abr02nite_02980 [Actinoplanes brasiliensis]
MSDEQRRDESVAPGPWWVVAGRALRFLLGALSLVLGLLWILLNGHTANAVPDIATGVVLTLGGLVLLMPHRIRLPRRTTAAVMSGVAVTGTAAGLLAEESITCCKYAFITERGWPFHWAQRGALADDPETAERVARSASWTVDLLSLAFDLLTWSYVGLLLVVAAVLIRRLRPVGAKDSAGESQRS